MLTGLGNLIVGYNRPPEGLSDGERVGSHTLIIGDEHRYSSAGGLIAGFRSTVSGVAASVSGGAGNGASGRVASVSGGESNQASGDGASVSGGANLTAGVEFCWRAGSAGTINDGC